MCKTVCKDCKKQYLKNGLYVSEGWVSSMNSILTDIFDLLIADGDDVQITSIMVFSR